MTTLPKNVRRLAPILGSVLIAGSLRAREEDPALWPTVAL